MKSTVYLVCEVIDLGYHVHEAHYDKTKAEKRAKFLGDARMQFDPLRDPFFVQTIEIQ